MYSNTKNNTNFQLFSFVQTILFLKHCKSCFSYKKSQKISTKTFFLNRQKLKVNYVISKSYKFKLKNSIKLLIL